MHKSPGRRRLTSGWTHLLVALTLGAIVAAGAADGFDRATGGVSAPAVKDAIARGHAFLAGLFDAEVELLPEFRGSKTCWLFHDNYLAAHLLAGTRPDLSRRIRATLLRFGVTNSGKIEIIFDEAKEPLPFRAYDLADVAVVSGWTIRTERVTTNVLHGWEQYADLLLLAASAQSRMEPDAARRNFDRAAAMWDGVGFKDRVVDVHHLYATYKLALYLIAAERLHVDAPHQSEVLKKLLAMQAADGGWKTDFNAGGPVGLANVETTCLAILALEAVERGAAQLNVRRPGAK